MAHTRRLNYLTDKSYQQTILTAYRRNFHYLFEFSDILPIFAMNLSSWNSYIYLSPAVGAQWWGLLLHSFYTYHIALYHHFWWCGAFLFC
jgi:hypothetical protein